MSVHRRKGSTLRLVSSCIPRVCIVIMETPSYILSPRYSQSASTDTRITQATLSAFIHLTSSTPIS